VATTPYTAYKRVVLRQGSKGSAVLALQRAIKVKPDGSFGPRTRASLVTFQKLQHISPNGIADRLVWDRLEKRDFPLVGYRGLTLKQGSKGVAVVALQRALRVTPDGAFGRATLAAVKAVQVRAKLAPTGVVSGVTWVAIERQIRR
jgi:peptidoglycan hydrolase-like protein with peptidoglycan-binding domain